LGNLKEGDDKGIGKMMKKYIFKELGVRGTDCLHLSQDRNLWQTLVNMVSLPTCSSMKDEFLD
jgi:hypothetical protein